MARATMRHPLFLGICILVDVLHGFTDAAAFLCVKLSLDLELTVAEENVGGFDIPVDDRPCVDEFGRRRELSDTLGGPRPVNAAILSTTQTGTPEPLQLWRLRTGYRRAYPRKRGQRQTRPVALARYILA